jgi:nitrogen fixation uncharacterized protein
MDQVNTDAQRFVEDLERDRQLRQEALTVPRKHLLQLAAARGYKVTGKDLYEAMRKKWANSSVPSSQDVKEEDDPDTCCACTFSESF